MPIEKSAGAVIFRKENKKFYYLLLYYSSSVRVQRDYWGFSKGRIEKGENELETARREIEEETGLKDIKFVKGFKEKNKYFFKFRGKNILKFVTFYLVETKTKEIRVSFEHLDYQWLPYEKAKEKLTFKNNKEILKKANDFLSRKNF